MAVLTQDEVKLGSGLMITVDGNIIGGSTSHTLTISPEYTEVQCKECGQTPWKILSKIGWEVQCDALYTTDYSTLLTFATHDKEVTVTFGEVSDDIAKAGFTVAPALSSDLLTSKKAKISSLSVTAAAGDNATLSVTFTGTESLYEAEEGD